MARVTVEDCVLKVPNRFDLVMKAAQRARDISAGAALTVERDDDKNPVVALREIADETINLDELGDALVQGLQKHVEVDEPEEDLIEFDIPGAGSPAGPAPEGDALEQAAEEASTEAPDTAAAVEEESARKVLYEDEDAPD